MSAASPLVGAVDLGSNSFYLLLATLEGGHLTTVDRIRERTAIAQGLDNKRMLTKAAQQRALTCLKRFQERLSALPDPSIRAVGTKALREAKNAGDFLRAAEEALGHRIEIISGREEARLIFKGVSHAVARPTQRKLVVDIGGASTECILGESDAPALLDSLSMGCVTFSEAHFVRGQLTEGAFQAAEIAAALELEALTQRYLAWGWDAAYGTSGTIQAVHNIVVENDFGTQRGITLKALRKLRAAIIDARDVTNLKLKGLQPDRTPVLAGGVAILIALFEQLDIKRLVHTPGGLREGVALDLLGPDERADRRMQAVNTLAKRHRVDKAQAQRVQRTALALYDQVASAWRIDATELRQMLAWAARLHEVGQSVSLSGYHKHGAYLVANSDMPGFSREEQAALASLVRSHRRRFGADRFDDLPPSRRKSTMRLAIILRVAAALHRARRDEAAPDFGARAGKRALALDFPKGWRGAHPLTQAALDQALANTGLHVELDNGASVLPPASEPAPKSKSASRR